MKKIVLLCFLLCLSLLSFSQTIVLDHEIPGTTTSFQYFGNGVLTGATTAVIANPNSSGINMSAMVGEFVKTDTAQPWCGSFSNPNPMVQIDLINNSEICIKVYMDHIGLLAMKLENSTTGGQGWIQSQPNTLINTWEELCFDVTQLSDEDGDQNGSLDPPAFGHNYDQVQLYFDLGTPGTGSSVTSYFDDLVLQGPGAPGGDITFQVDMNNFGPPFTTPYISGSFNNWSGTANPMTDMNLDGIWEGTVTGLMRGNYQYQFTLDDWTIREDFTGTELCAVPGPGGRAVREVIVVFDDTLDALCWNSCFECGNAANITINLNMSQQTVDTTGVYVAGGQRFGNPGDYELKDPDGDGVYSITLEREIGFTSDYTFTNGFCPNYSCKEFIGGQPCATGPFDDRHLPPVSGDTTVTTCFSVCSDDTACMVVVPPSNDITFAVDMKEYTGSFSQVYVSGTLNNWAGTANPLDDSDGDGVWTGTITGVLEMPHEFKFTLDDWNAQEEFTGTETCVITDPSGQFTNRDLNVTSDTTLPQYCFNSCYACGASVDITFEVNMRMETVDPGGVFIAGGAEFGVPGEYPLEDMDGDGIYTLTVERGIGFESDYAFTNGNCPDFSCKEDLNGQPCAVGQFNDRQLAPVMSDATVSTCYAQCSNDTTCMAVGISDDNLGKSLFTIHPVLVDDFAVIEFHGTFTQPKHIKVMDTQGKLVWSSTLAIHTDRMEISSTGMASGVYFVQAISGDRFATQKIVVK